MTTKRLFIDEATKLTMVNLYCMVTAEVQELHLYGDMMQIGAKDMYQTPGVRCVDSIINNVSNIE